MHAAQAGHHRVLMRVKASAKRMKKVHCSLLCCAAGSGSPFKELYKACSGSSPTLRHNQGCSGIPGPTKQRAQMHQGTNDLTADSQGHTIAGRPRSISCGSARAGGELNRNQLVCWCDGACEAELGNLACKAADLGFGRGA